MAPRRSFDIELVEGSDDLDNDIEALGRRRARCLRHLNSLTDEDIHEWARLPLPRGQRGSWVLVPVGHHTAMCQFAKGTPGLWRSGRGRGCLTVVRILDEDTVDELYEALTDEP